MRTYLNHGIGEFWLTNMLMYLNYVGYIKLDHCEIYYSINIVMWTLIYIYIYINHDYYLHRLSILSGWWIQTWILLALMYTGVRSCMVKTLEC